MTATILQFKDDMKKDEPTGPVKLNLGCNQNPKAGYVNVDIEKFDGVDVVADLEKRWPWEDGSVDEIFCADLPEHLRMWWDEPDPELIERALSAIHPLNDVSQTDPIECIRFLIEAITKPKRHYGIIHFMEEANRVLKVGGRLEAIVPSTDGRGWAQDPTHVSYWNENTVQYFAGDLKRLYPHLIKGNWKHVYTGTSMPNPMGISWIRMVLEKA